jgi:hypothetical protein
MWRLADMARVCQLAVSKEHRPRVFAPAGFEGRERLNPAAKSHEVDLADEAGTQYLVLERRGDRAHDPHRLFVAGRIKKRFDNKFVLHCFDLRTGKRLWDAKESRGGNDWHAELRLRGKGNEPGFFEAFVCGDLLVVHGLYDALAFGLGDGRLRWRYRVPFDFEIYHAVLSGDLLVLAGKTETLALFVPTRSANGEVAWRQKEEGDLYIPPYFVGDRLISVRKLPFNVTSRYRATGKLIGRLELPPLSVERQHPLFAANDVRHTGDLPVTHEGDRLVVTDGWYYIAVDTERLLIRWKRLIDSNDRSVEPAMRLALARPYLAVVKRDYDAKTIYMLSSETGRVLWNTNVKDPQSPQPVYSMRIHGDRIYGFLPHPGQGFYAVAMDCRTGKTLFRHEHGGYSGRPCARLRPRLFDSPDGKRQYLVVEVQDRQDFELRAIDPRQGGKAVRLLRKKGSGTFGVHGRVSTTVQNGRLILMSKGEMAY